MKSDQQPFQPQQDQPEPIDWERFRAETAAKALQALIVGENIRNMYNFKRDSVCIEAVMMADRLIEELKRKEANV